MHVLGRLKANKLPKWVIFLDTETYEKEITKTKKQLFLKVGYARLTRRSRGGTFETVSECVFTTRFGLFRWLSGVLVHKQRYYIVAHNVSFDWRITGLSHYFDSRLYKRTVFIESGLNFIVRYSKKKQGVVVMNNMQLFNMSLRKLGASIGFDKGEVDFKAVSKKDLIAYCKRDVEVMVVAWNKLCSFIRDNDLGNFNLTLASDAMGAFRHRFMDQHIVIHNNPDAIALERAAYHGGRVEMFFQGRTNCGPIYSLDVNSMYPYVMRQSPVPIRLVRFFRHPTPAQFESVRRAYGYIVEATIKIDEPTLPLVYNNRLCFPVGTVRGTFARPELERSLISGQLLEVHTLAAYEEAVIFDKYVYFFYEKRKQYKKEGNLAFEMICKLMLNSLYGKFGQRNLVYKKIAENTKVPDGMYSVIETWNQRPTTYRVYKGVVEKETGYEEGYNSFVAIAAYITSLARAQLYEYIKLAGRENVFYCDTDSLFVNELGHARLSSVIDPARLGALKLEGIEPYAEFYGSKRYRFGTKIRSKGIRAGAREISPGMFEQEKWRGFRGALRSGDSDSVQIDVVRKEISSKYLKGFVLPSGVVSPFRL